MSKYGFDIDGTLTRTAIRLLACDLLKAGHEIHVITGALEDSGEWTIESRLAQLSELGVEYTKLHRCFGKNLWEVGEEKGRVCRENRIDLLFEDSSTYVRAVGDATLCCFVVNNPKGFHLG